MKRLFSTLLLVSLTTTLSAQNKTVTGVVNDETGYPIPGAFVLQQGTSNGAMTDLDGLYEIKVPEGAVLVVSCMGYHERQVTVGKAGKYDFQLSSDALMMEEAVVVGYGTQKAKDLTAPIANLKGEELVKQTAANPMAALQGKVAGVQVINTGVPGGSPSVKIRGVGSIGDYAKPLYVIDGVFVEDMGFISNSDIEEITVLKDASAAAIYGVRAANGVVIVTTKKGTAGRTKISYDGYVGLQVPVNVVKLTNAEQYIDLLNEANANTSGYVPKSLSSYPGDTDWYSELLRAAPTHSHSLDISGGTEKTNYSFGLSYYNQDGIMKASNSYDRFNFRTRLDRKVTDWLSIGTNALVSQYTRVDPNTNAYFQAFVNPPVYNVYNKDNTAAYPEKFDSPQLYGFGAAYGNPYASAFYNDAREKGVNMVSSVFAEFKFMKDKLKIKSAYNLDLQAYEYRNYQLENYVGGSQGLGKSRLSKTFGIRQKHILDNTATYADNKGKASYSAMIGQSIRIEKMSGMTGTANDVPNTDEQAKYLGTGSQSNLFVTDLNPTPYTFNGISFFARGTCNYDDRYLATVTIREDGSSKYNRKWGFFPSVGLGWVLSEENFMKGGNLFDYLKVRASWGLLGNDSVPANSSVIVGSSGIGASGVFGDTLVDGVGAQTVYQNYLEWEVVNEIDLGADFAFMDNRLSGELDLYRRVTDNVVFYVPIATGGGVSELLSNNGKVANSGIELGLRWNDSITDDWTYNIGLNLTTISNKVLSLEGKDYIPGASVRGDYTTRTMVGYPIGAFWGYETEGVFQTEGEALMAGPMAPLPIRGAFKYKDQDGNGRINEDDKTYLGSPIPWLSGGLDLGMNYKKWDFSLSIQGQAGNKILNAKRMNRDVFADGNYDLDFYKNCFRPDRKSDKYPSAEAYTSAITQTANSFFVEDGSYIRIQNVQVGYTMDNFKKWDFIKSVRVYLSAQRPYSFFTYNGFTTEVGGSPIATGIDTSTYPMQAIYSFGLKANF